MFCNRGYLRQPIPSQLGGKPPKEGKQDQPNSWSSSTSLRQQLLSVLNKCTHASDSQVADAVGQVLQPCLKARDLTRSGHNLFDFHSDKQSWRVILAESVGETARYTPVAIVGGLALIISPRISAPL